MFEQESYNFEVPVEPLHEGDLFYNYEVGTWKITSGILAIFAISTLVSLGFIGTVGQTNVLMARGCDSPFVGRVCQVLDMAYVSTVLFGTDREYVDAAYERTDLGEAEVTWIDQTGVPAKFEYPEGYFYKEPSAQDPLAMNSTDGFLAPGIPNVSPVQSGNSLIDTPAVAPKKNKNTVVGEIPDSPFDLSDTTNTTTTVPGKTKGNKGNTNSADSKNSAAQNGEPKITPDQMAEATKNLNKKPFKDLANAVNELLANKEVNLESEFHISATGNLDKNGQFTKNSFRFTKAESTDPKMVGVVKRSIEAFNESGFLQILQDLQGEKLNLDLKQDSQNVTAIVQTELERETRANTLKSVLKLGLDIAIKKKEGDIKALETELASNNDPKKLAELQNDRDDLALLQGTSISAEGKKLTINFAVDKGAVQVLIRRKLQEQAAEAASELKKPSGNAMTTRNDNTAVK